MNEVRRKSEFTRDAVTVFLVGSAAILVLDIAESVHFISDLTESVCRLAFWSLLLLTLTYAASRAVLGRNVRIIGVVWLAIIFVELSLGVVHDVPQLATLPLIGSQSPYKAVVDGFVTAGWSCGGMLLIYNLVISLERSKSNLERRVEIRTQHLTEAKSRIEEEASERRRIEEDLKETEFRFDQQEEANRRLEATLAKLKQTQDRLIQQERLNALGQVARGLAHDLNNALTPVIAYSELLLKKASPEQKQALEHMLRGATHSAGIIKQLQYFCLPSDEPDVREVVRLKNVIDGAIALTRPRWHDDALRHGVTVTITPDVDSDLTILGNAVELTQLYTNMILNAIDALPEGGNITARAWHDGAACILEVQDDGVGMPEEERRRCFEPYYTNKPNGCGLGLSVCHGIVDRHKGQIEIRDPEGRGTIFRVTLPIEESEEPAAPVQQRSEAPDKSRLLYIDDHDLARKSIAALFRESGHQVTLADGGLEGLKMIKSDRFDLIVTDLGMSDVTGYEIVQQVKRHDPQLPVIVISGWSRQDVMGRFAAGSAPDAIIEKPVTSDAIRAALDSMKDRTIGAR